MNLIDKLLEALKDEDDASLMYIKLAEEVEKKGHHKAAHLLRNIAVDESKHKDTLKAIIEELKVIGDLVEAAAAGPGIYWWVRLPDRAQYEQFDTLNEAKKYVEQETGLLFAHAKWTGPYTFDLGLWKGPRHITFFEGDEGGNPTGHHLHGEFS